MNEQNLKNGFEQNFFNQMREQELWKRISKGNEIIWTTELLERYADKVDWDELSENRDIEWSVEIIEKFRNRINFKQLSENLFSCSSSNSLSRVEIIRKYPDLFDWVELSNSDLPSYSECLAEFADRWCWKTLTDNWNVSWTKSLFEMYRHRIPVLDIDTFIQSRLWSNLLDIDEKILVGKILDK